MSKNYLEDVSAPARSKSIRNIPVPNHRQRKTRRTPEVHEPVAREDREMPEPPQHRYREEYREEQETTPTPPPPHDHERKYAHYEDDFPRRKSKKGLFVWLGIFSAIIIGVFVVLNSIASATITITEKKAEADIAASFSATSSADLIQTYEKSETVSETLQATQEENVERKASGTIIIYNDFDGEEQRLVRTTRFATPDGQIFRIDNAVTVPGKKGSVPGSVEAVVYADEPGETFNIGLTRFTIPGFEGTDRYQSFYAESKTPMTGGFVGEVKTVSEAAREETVEELTAELENKLQAAVSTEAPEENIVFGGEVEITTNQAVETQNSDGTVTISVSGSAKAPMVNKADLSARLAETSLNGTATEGIDITNIDQLNIELEDDTLTVAGRGMFNWPLNTEEIAQKLAGADRKSISSILAQYPGVERAETTISPFWRQSLPKNPSDITINIEK